MDADGGTANIYYGTADCSIALARASVRALPGGWTGRAIDRTDDGWTTEKYLRT